MYTMKTRATPPVMGWSSWNNFRQSINESVIIQTAQALSRLGLKKVGYHYVNIDDCWQSSERDSQGNLQFDHITFPNGAELSKKIHALGLKIGLYSACGPMTCEDRPGTFGKEVHDAATLVNLGIDFLKYDYCHVIDMTTDESLLDQSPDLLAITLKNQSTNEEYNLPLHQASLSGMATLQPENDGTEFLTGLAHAKGQATFTLPPHKGGRYYLNVLYRKTHNPKRQLVVAQSGQESANLFFPRSSGWSETGRVEVILELSDQSNLLTFTNPIKDRKTDAIWRYNNMARALAKATQGKRPINLAVCEHGRNQPWEWAPAFSNSYRIAQDISANWASVVESYDALLKAAPYAVAGSYADPDMLEVGNGDLTADQNRAHFTLWAFMSAPLVLGNDIRQARPDDEWLKIVTNKTVIHVNQTAPYLPSQLLSQAENVDILVKYLDDGTGAVCFFNRSDHETSYRFDLANLPKSVNGQPLLNTKPEIREMWGQTSYSLTGSILKLKMAPTSVLAFQLQ